MNTPAPITVEALLAEISAAQAARQPMSTPDYVRTLWALSDEMDRRGMRVHATTLAALASYAVADMVACELAAQGGA